MAAPRRVSVIVPTCDRPAMLRQALASIRALEADDLTFEILVGDNGKAEETHAAAAEFGAIHIVVTRRGAGAARNAGLSAATGDYIAFLDDDDVWLSDNVRAHLAVLDANPDLEAAFGRIVSADMELRPLCEAWPEETPGEGDELVRTMLSGYYPQIGATLARASVRDAIGLFDEALLGDQDWDWQLRLARRRKVGFANAPCVLFRQRPPGSFDALRMRRLGFSRRVFFRHASSEWRLWGSPQRFLQAYRQVLWQYFEYFGDAAVSRAEAGQGADARRALLGAFRTFPLRTAFHLAVGKPLRKALFASPARTPAPTSA
jgi:glycosyltransferase involved in cell wall biosynthesis